MDLGLSIVLHYQAFEEVPLEVNKAYSPLFRPFGTSVVSQSILNQSECITKDVHIINNKAIYVIEDISSQDFIIQKKTRHQKSIKSIQGVSQEYLRSTQVRSILGDCSCSAIYFNQTKASYAVVLVLLLMSSSNSAPLSLRDIFSHVFHDALINTVYVDKTCYILYMGRLKNNTSYCQAQVQKVQGLRTKDLDLGLTLNLVCHPLTTTKPFFGR